MMQNKSSIVLNMNLNASGFARGIKSVIGSVKNMNESMKDSNEHRLKDVFCNERYREQCHKSRKRFRRWQDGRGDCR